MSPEQQTEDQPRFSEADRRSRESVERLARMQHGAILGAVPTAFAEVQPLYALPTRLIEQILDPPSRRPLHRFGSPAAPAGRPGLERVIREHLRFERDLAAYCEQQRILGFWHGQSIGPGVLAPAEAESLTDEELRLYREAMPDLTEHTLKTHVGRGNALANQERLRRRAYVGWLVENPQYQEELLALRQWVEPRYPSLRCFPALPWLNDPSPWIGTFFTCASSEPAATDPAAPTPACTPENDEGMQRYQQFCVRWCLSGLITWDLPEPQGPLLPAPGPGISRSLGSMGVCIFIPYSFKCWGNVISTGSIRALLDAAAEPPLSLDGQPVPDRLAHLREWLTLGARGGERINRYADCFTARFYWRVLEGRYARKMNGLRMHLYGAMGGFLHGPAGSPSARRRRLGSNSIRRCLSRRRSRRSS